MLKTVISVASLVCALIISAPASAQYEGCVAQCYQVYNYRFNYCYERHGGNTYEAELCMLNEYDVYMDCLNGCSSTYGYNAMPGKRIPRFLAAGISCQGSAKLTSG